MWITFQVLGTIVVESINSEFDSEIEARHLQRDK
jgi:hypothetical protein